VVLGYARVRSCAHSCGWVSRALGMQRCSLTLHSRCGGVGGIVQDALRSASASPFPQGTPEMDAATAQEYQEHQDALRNTSAASSRVSASLMQQFDESRSPTLAPEVRHRAAAPPSQLDWIPLLLCCRVQSLSPTAAWSCCTLPTSLTLTRNTLHVQFASLSPSNSDSLALSPSLQSPALSPRHSSLRHSASRASVESFPPSSDSDRDDSDGGGGGDDPRTSAASLLAASIALDAGVHPRLAAKIAAGTSIRVRALVMNLQSSILMAQTTRSTS
jgi:hypothetical protein